ncbi:MAG: IS66 family insertion sequence element accessory protein TnpB [Planctomycetaceae bacterium]|nr:IS66 family insertion sequence element accessory protein TnpB [Planctomycetaceae bacterium]MBV8311137.1 IS66 family insertion sequence element accessory protein TnpB [Planctomycetaceae bacterium]
MIQLTPHMRILLAVAPVDFRKGTDGLARLCRDVLRSDPLGGAVFCFRNRKATALRLLVYDGQGMWMCQKRLSAGKFRWWPKEGQEGVAQLDVQELQILLWNGNPARSQAAPAWRPIAPAVLQSMKEERRAGARAVNIQP